MEPNLTLPSRFPVSSRTGMDRAFDVDWLVIGSGFGGSVSALRLREKGYSVAVLEAGRRFADDELPRSTWDLRRYFWAPRLGMRGIMRLTTFRDVAVLTGSGPRLRCPSGGPFFMGGRSLRLVGRRCSLG